MQPQKIQITLTSEETAALSLKGKALGYNVTKFIKFLVTQEAYSIIESIPSFIMSKSLEEETLKAIEEHKKGKSKEIKNVEELEEI